MITNSPQVILAKRDLPPCLNHLASRRETERIFLNVVGAKMRLLRRGDPTRDGVGRTVSAKRREMPSTCPRLQSSRSEALAARDGECVAYISCTTRKEHRSRAGQLLAAQRAKNIEVALASQPTLLINEPAPPPHEPPTPPPIDELPKPPPIKEPAPVSEPPQRLTAAAPDDSMQC